MRRGREGTPAKRSTHFLNVDLDIYSKRDLGPLVESFGANVHVLHVGPEDLSSKSGPYGAHLEIAGYSRTADSTIRRFCKLIEGLPKPARSLWSRAAIRSFSVGIQPGERPSCQDFTIAPATVRAVAAVDAQIVVSIYASALRRG